MKTEKIVLYFIATLLGLLVAAFAFYFFSTKKTSPSEIVISISPSPTPMPSIILTLSQPKDEEVVNKKTTTLSGKTRSDAVIVILTNGTTDIVSPTASGNFSAQVTLSNGQNVIEAIAIAADGQMKSIKKTVTYSEEEF